MKTEEIIHQLKIKNVRFELKENQVIIRVARRFCLKLRIENDNVVKYEDSIKPFGLFSKEQSLKVYTKKGMIGYLIIALFIALWYILGPEPDFFHSSSGKSFIFFIAFSVLCQLLEYLYYNRRLSKIKKMLNIND